MGDFAYGEIAGAKQFPRVEKARAQEVTLGRKPGAPAKQPTEVTRTEAPFARQNRQRKLFVQMLRNEGLDAFSRLLR